jgi:hypothetical protein
MASAEETMEHEYDKEEEEDEDHEEEQMDESTTADNQTLFEQVVSGLTIDRESSSCISTTEGGGSQSGGLDGVSINNITILIMLAHGLINLTREAINNQRDHPYIEHDSLPNVKNLAYFGFAPTGMVNIGVIDELSIISDNIQRIIEPEIQKIANSSLQSIQNKTKQLMRDTNVQTRLQSIKDPRPKAKVSIVSKICNNICFRFRSVITPLSTVVNHIFNDMFSVCKNILPSTIFSSSGGTPKGVTTKLPLRKPYSMRQSLSISDDMCVLLFDDLRSSIQNFDRSRFPIICANLQGQVVCDAALENCEERCRKLYIVKGFGSDIILPFVNKHFQYDYVFDKPLNMGVVKLKFSIDGSGNVKSIVKKYDPKKLMLEAGAIQAGTTSAWSSMQEWIEKCVNPTDGTVCIVDLSCAGIVCQNPTLVELPHLESPGGGKIIKKKSYSRKKTRRNHHTKRIKNKSKHIKRVRNKRSIRKNNTKKLRK